MDDNAWDGVDIHYGFAPGQSAQEADMACGLVLSTWSGPHSQKGKSWIFNVGYTFTPEEVTCLQCVIWMEKNFNKCECGKIAVNKRCTVCAEEWFESNSCSKCLKLKKYCSCN